MNGFRTDDESESITKVYSSNIPINHDIKSSSSPVSDKRSNQQQSNFKLAQPNVLSNLAAAVLSTSIDGQSMPGHRTRKKASSTLQRQPATSNIKQTNNSNDNESFDASDELLDNLVKNAALTTTKDVIRQRKLARYAQRQSCMVFFQHFVFL